MKGRGMARENAVEKSISEGEWGLPDDGVSHM
jgi:hypothetical protein